MNAPLDAHDALVKLDGVELNRATNSFSDVIPGVQIELKTAKPGTLVSVGVTRPTAAISQGVQDFVSAYNELMNDDRRADQGGQGADAGALRGDLGVRELQHRLAKLPTKILSSPGDGAHTFAEIGVRTNRDGTLSLDSSQAGRGAGLESGRRRGPVQPRPVQLQPLPHDQERDRQGRAGHLHGHRRRAAAPPAAASGKVGNAGDDRRRRESGRAAHGVGRGRPHPRRQRQRRQRDDHHRSGPRRRAPVDPRRPPPSGGAFATPRSG